MNNSWYAIIDGRNHAHILSFEQLAQMLAKAKFEIILKSGPWSSASDARRALKLELRFSPRKKRIKEEVRCITLDD